MKPPLVIGRLPGEGAHCSEEISIPQEGLNKDAPHCMRLYCITAPCRDKYSEKQDGMLTILYWLSSALAAADIVRTPYHLQRLCASQLDPEQAQALLGRLTLASIIP